MQDCSEMLETTVVLRSYPNSIFECNRLYQSSYEENRKRTSQRYLPQTSRRSKFFIFLYFSNSDYFVYFSRKERERWISSQRDPRSKSPKSTPKTQSSRTSSESSDLKPSSRPTSHNSPPERNEMYEI